MDGFCSCGWKVIFGFLWWLGGCLMGWVTFFFLWLYGWMCASDGLDRSFWLLGGIGGFRDGGMGGWLCGGFVWWLGDLFLFVRIVWWLGNWSMGWVTGFFAGWMGGWLDVRE